MSIVIPVPRGIDRQLVSVRRDIRIAFFGSPIFAVLALRRLHADGWPIGMVITAPDKPVGRKMVPTPTPVKTAALELDIPVRTPATLKDDAFWTEFSELRPDLCVVVAYNKILPKRYLDVPRLGFVNIHPSLLPAYRGPSPIQTAVLDGCAATGVSIMQLDEETDHGPILAQESWTIPTGLDSPAAHDELFRIGAELLIRILPEYGNGTLVPQPQNHALATFTRKFTREDGKLDWTQSAVRINDRVRALGTNPGTWTRWQEKALNIFHTHIAEGQVPHGKPGTVFAHAGNLAVHCGEGALVLETIQLEGAKRMSARDFGNGRPTFVGSQLSA
jgi:methionyl-tRNA formyltransferase